MSQGAGSNGARARSVITVPESKSEELKVLFASGLLSAGRPDRTIKRLGALAKFGPSLAGTFAAAAARSPHNVGVIDDERQLTYGELDTRIRRIAVGLANLGAGADGGIAMLARNSIYAVETMVAASRAGADTLLLNTFLSGPQLTEIIAREKPRFVVVDAELRPNVTELPAGTTVIIASPANGTVTGEPTLDDLAGAAGPDLPAPKRQGRVIILTSGTTGTPKGAQRHNPKGLGAAASLLSRIGLKAPETMFIAPPIFHTLGLAFLQLAPALNTTMVLRRKPDPETILSALAQHRCTSAVFVPVMAQRLADLPADLRRQHDTSALRTVVCSGAALPPDVCTRFMDAYGDVLYNLYGSTEVSWATIATPEDLRLRPGTAGRPPLGTRLALLDENRRPVPVGEVGAIFVGNAMMFNGYTNGNTKEVVKGLMASGDLGQLTEEGLLMVLGRDDDMVIVGGENVYPIEVEDLLIARPEVKEVVVVGVPDRDLGQRLAAYVVLHEGARLSADEVREMVRSKLARFSVPRDVIFLDALPRNTVGKIVPRMLPKPEEVAAQLRGAQQ